MTDLGNATAQELAEKAGWVLDTTGMAKSGYAPRKAQLAEWVIELAAALEAAEKEREQWNASAVMVRARKLLKRAEAAEARVKELEEERDEARDQNKLNHDLLVITCRELETTKEAYESVIKDCDELHDRVAELEAVMSIAADFVDSEGGQQIRLGKRWYALSDAIAAYRASSPALPEARSKDEIAGTVKSPTEGE